MVLRIQRVCKRLPVAAHQGVLPTGRFSPATAGFFPPCVMDNKKKKMEVPVPATDAPVESKGPFKVFRIDDVSVSVFSRDRVVKGETVTFYSASFSRSYKDASGAWKYTNYFDSEDLGKVMALAKDASEFIQAKRGVAAPSPRG